MEIHTTNGYFKVFLFVFIEEIRLTVQFTSYRTVQAVCHIDQSVNAAYVEK